MDELDVAVEEFSKRYENNTILIPIWYQYKDQMLQMFEAHFQMFQNGLTINCFEMIY